MAKEKRHGINPSTFSVEDNKDAMIDEDGTPKMISTKRHHKTSFAWQAKINAVLEELQVEKEFVERKPSRFTMVRRWGILDIIRRNKEDSCMREKNQTLINLGHKWLLAYKGGNMLFHCGCKITLKTYFFQRPVSGFTTNEEKLVINP